MTVAQWHRNQIIRGHWLLAKKELKMDSCLRGAILNLNLDNKYLDLLQK
jgi:hypothetical protein